METVLKPAAEAKCATWPGMTQGCAVIMALKICV
jgi:hypothetical protein